MTQWSADQIRQAALTPRWSALSQIGGVASDLVNFDPRLIREPRLLVPIDVQAFVVRAGVNDGDGMLRLPFRDGQTPLPPVDLGDGGTSRPPGVHLLWSVPAALTRGRIVPDPSAPNDRTKGRLQLPLLPDRWVVLRLAVRADARDPLLAGWVIEADTGTSTPLTDWPSGTSQQVATAIDPSRLDAHAGGLAWLQSYDAALGRCSFYDDLKDLEGASLVGDAVSYLVAGWWSASANDPLDGVGTDLGYRQRLSDLGWNDPDHPSPDADQRAQSSERYKVAKTFGLPVTDRYTQPLSAGAAKAPVGEVGSGYVAPTAQRFKPAYSSFVSEAMTAALLPPAPTRSTLLHGRLHGVPLSGAIAPDSAPAADALRVVLGSSTPDVAAALTVAGADMGSADQDARRAAERLLVAFTSGMLMQAGSSDSWADIAEYEHAQAFISQAGGIEAVDRYLDKPGPPSDPGAGARVGSPSKLAAKGAGGGKALHVATDATVLWNADARPMTSEMSSLTARLRENFDGIYGAVRPQQPATIREVPRPAPSYRQPAAPVLAVAGGGRALSAVEREEADSALMCRLSDQTGQGLAGILGSDELLTGLGTSAVPPEILDLAREALAEDPYLSRWRASRASSKGFASGPTTNRMRAEAALSYAYYAGDNQRLSKYVGAPVTSPAQRQTAVEGLLRLSVSDGVWAHPEGVTMWGQPWRPLFCDWEVQVDLDPAAAWNLDDVDLNLPDGASITAANTLTFTGRSALQPAVAKTIATGIERWLTEEQQRDLGGHGLADPQTEAALSGLRDALARTDMMSAALDGIREQLLGLEYDRGLVHAGDGSTRQPTAQAAAQLDVAGRLRLTRARVVDAFGRFAELPVDALLVPERIAEGSARDVLLRPRITAPARWRFDLVDATSTAIDAALARVDQPSPDKQVNPVAGFLLPDHMDESLEVFAADGTPLGELLHDGYSDAVTWEIAPGRTDVPPAAGPTDDPDPSRHLVGWIAAGVVGADAADRKGTPNRGETESSLSAMLRAIDTTLWTVDPFGSLGTEHIAGLVGRPIAVVRARLSLDIRSDAGDVAYSGTATQADRQAAYEAMAAQVFQVRLGEVTRTDDGLLGYFVDDDYTQFHVVDRSIARNALPSGRGRGVLDPDSDPLTPVAIEHKYVNQDGFISIRPGQTVRLTLLMHPGGKVHLTSGILPRVDRALARDWVNPGLSVLAPSLRSGPLLIDVDKTRLPKVASFPVDQLFTHRDTPTTWRDNPILAATQSALLPDTQPEVREGWVRVAPNKPTQTGA